MSQTVEVALSLGSNQGARKAQLAAALRGLDAELLEDMRVSGLYETKPLGVSEEQPDYLNLCVVGRCILPPDGLLARCQAMELRAGRKDKGGGKPRPLDLDLLYHGESRGDGDALRLPHPGLPGRRFVLAPLAELRPDWRHPADGRSVSVMLADLEGEQELRRLDSEEGWWRRGHAE